jgi:uncharacterized protein YndB with AHSA1/START domain
MNEQAQQVSIQKQFSASRDELYKAWTEENQLKQWWRPMDKELVSVENEIQEGGTVVYTFSNDLKIQGEYKEVQPGQRLVYSWIWELPEDSHHKCEYLLTVLFNNKDNGSELQVTQENFKNEHSIQPHQDGWEQALENLTAFLDKIK